MNLHERDLLLEELHTKGDKTTRGYIADNFGKYANPYEMLRFLARYELFKKIVNVKGAICECGVKSGSGLFQWWHLADALDPDGSYRPIYGFDTFDGVPSVSAKDGSFIEIGDMKDTTVEELQLCAKIEGRPNRSIFLVPGDFVHLADPFVSKVNHLIIALLFLDFDLYEPTKKALEVFLPRMPKGSIIAFDELGNDRFPGETLAVLESLDLKRLELRQFSFNPDICYACV